MARTSKPYQRPEASRKSNPDAPGTWKHDLHQTSLADRISSPSSSHHRLTSSSSKPSLLSRISGGHGKELLSTSTTSQTKLHGFGEMPVNLAKANSGLELMPSSTGRQGGSLRRRGGGVGVVRGVEGRSLVQSGIEAALGNGSSARQNVRQVVVQPQPVARNNGIQTAAVNIMGAARGSTWVRVEGLAVGTTAEDVASAFAPLPIETAILSPIQPTNSVSVDLEFLNKQPAEEAITKYHGAVADGGTLSVSLIKPLAGRIGISSQPAVAAPVSSTPSLVSRVSGGGGAGRAMGGRELLGGSVSGKLYSDTILATNPRSAVITLATDEPAPTPFYPTPTSANGNGNWGRGGHSLTSRIGRGKGQIGGGSYADMMVD